MKKSTTFLLILLAIFFTSTLYLLYLNFNKTPATNTLIPRTSIVPTKNSTPTAVSTSDPTANWKTYTNNQYKYSVKYPADYSVIETSPDYVRFSPGTNNLNEPSNETYLSIQLDTNFQQSPEAVYKKTADGKILRITQILMDADENQKLQIQAIFDQILSTFKFTQPSTSDLRSQVENWTSYTQSPTKLSWDKCDGESTISSSLKGMMATYPVFIKEINGLKLAYTSKLDFTAQDVARFTICEAGNFYPIYTFNDKILWTNACSTGIVPDNPKCEDTLTQIQKLYGYTK